MALSAVGLVALLCIRWLLGRDADPLLSWHRWSLPLLVVFGYPLPILVAAAAEQPSCGHNMVVSLVLGLTVYLPMVTVMVSGHRGVRLPDVQRARRAAKACALFLALWGVALLVFQLK